MSNEVIRAIRFEGKLYHECLGGHLCSMCSSTKPWHTHDLPETSPFYLCTDCLIGDNPEFLLCGEEETIPYG